MKGGKSILKFQARNKNTLLRTKNIKKICINYSKKKNLCKYSTFITLATKISTIVYTNLF